MNAGINRNMDSEACSGKVSDENEEHVIRQWRKAILVIKWQRTWLNCVLLVFKVRREK